MELRLYEDLVNDMVSVMGSSWENYIPIQFSYSKTDVNPTLSQIIGLDEIVIIVDMKMQFSDASGRMSILPAGRDAEQYFCGNQQGKSHPQGGGRGQVGRDL